MSGTQVKNRVFSGAQPSGNMHLGNYLGAFKNWAALQQDFECLYCVVDMHAITVWQDPEALRHQTREAAAAYMASGVDISKSILFNQSQVSGHAELAWIFSCVARLGWLNRMTQFKDKAGKNREKASVGLYIYPNLMAADILLYKATHVPVGEDQKQHLELTRDIAQKFNHDFQKEIFPVVDPVIMQEGARVMSLRDGRQKMSKSDPSDMARINLNDSADTIAQKIRKARTDAAPIPGSQTDLNDRPEAKNLLTIYGALGNQTLDEVCAAFEGQGFANFKKALLDRAVETLSPVTERMQQYMQDPAEIDRILHSGAERASVLAEPVLKDVKSLVGFLS